MPSRFGEGIAGCNLEGNKIGAAHGDSPVLRSTERGVARIALEPILAAKSLFGRAEYGSVHLYFSSFWNWNDNGL